MKLIANTLIHFLIFLSSAIVIILASYPYDIEGFSHGARLITLFVLVYFITIGCLKAFEKRTSLKNITITLLIPFISFVIINLIFSSLKNSLKISPLYITWILGFTAGIAHHKKGFNIINILLLALFPIIMTFNLYDLWRHKMEYGNLTGDIEKTETISFEFVDKENNIISNQDLIGNVVLLDFWFISCPPCWESFPEVQNIYDEYKSTQSFKLYAVNRNDDPENLFHKTEEKGYTFPVLRGTQEQMDSLGAYFYPTVMIINRKGELVYKGKIENAKSVLKDLMKK